MAIDTPARIAILGAGPIGLEAALYARYLGYEVDIYERGLAAENVLRWGHVRMFSPFEMNRSSLGLAALKAQDPSWQAPPDEALLTGREFAEQYLIPLAQSDLLVDGLHLQTEVLSIGRDALLKGEFACDEAREEHEFRILVRGISPDDHGRERFATADAVIDTTGTYGNHNWLGQSGIPALGELAAQEHIEYGLPDVLGAERDHYASRNILLVGSGDSAATNLVALAELAAQARDTWITWIDRTESDEKSPQPISCNKADGLKERERLARKANALAANDSNHISYFSGTTVEALSWHADLERFSVRLMGKHAGELEFDRIIANVGYRPDSSIYRELHVKESAATGAPRNKSLVTAEPDFYVLGAKSYGRDSSFLISTGLEQIRELFAILGDRADLNLYATMAGLV